MWNLESGLKLVRALEDTARDYGYHIALGGSVLKKGESEKDIDLYFLPMDNPAFPENSEGLVRWLSTIWGEYDYIEKYRAEPESWVVETLPPPNANPYRLERGPDGRITATPKKKVRPESRLYKYKVKFVRPAGERIDVFVA